MRKKCSPCRTSAWNESDHCLNVRPERLRLLTRNPCGWASATWCLLTWLPIPKEDGGEEVEEAMELRGEAIGLEEAEEGVIIVITFRGALAHSNLGGTQC